MAKAVIFDVDGTLIDSNDYHAQAWVDAFQEFGHDVSFEALRGQIGKGGDQLLPVFLNRDEIKAIGETLEARRGEILKERYLEKIRPFENVRALFEKLRGEGVSIILASSAKKDELVAYKKIANVEDIVDDETSSDDAEKSKPEPDIFLAALRRLKGINPADVLVVGDSPYDAEAAGKAGVKIIGVLCGGFSEADLSKAGCSAIYRNPSDLLMHYVACFS